MAIKRDRARNKEPRRATKRNCPFPVAVYSHHPKIVRKRQKRRSTTFLNWKGILGIFIDLSPYECFLLRTTYNREKKFRLCLSI